MKRQPKGTPTHTNLYVLATIFAKLDQVPNRVLSVDAAHLKRCIDAGLITATRETLTLTPAGVAARADFKAQRELSAANYPKRSEAFTS